MNNELVTQVFLDITKIQSTLCGGLVKFSRYKNGITIEFQREPMMLPVFVLHMTETQFQETIQIYISHISDFINGSSSLFVAQIPKSEHDG